MLAVLALGSGACTPAELWHIDRNAAVAALNNDGLLGLCLLNHGVSPRQYAACLQSSEDRQTASRCLDDAQRLVVDGCLYAERAWRQSQSRSVSCSQFFNTVQCYSGP